MSTNQRENERMERKLAKKRKRQKIAWIAIILVIIALLVMKLCEIDFSSIGDKSDSPVSVTGEEAFPFELESGEDFGFGVFSDNIYALNADAFTVIGEADGRELLSVEHGYANPIVETSGSYCVLYDQGTGAYMLCSKKNQIYEKYLPYVDFFQRNSHKKYVLLKFYG